MTTDPSAAASAAAIRMAMAGLALSPEDLAARAGTTVAAVSAAVRGDLADAGEAGRIRAALEEAGARFVAGEPRGATVYVRTDDRPRPAIRLVGDLRYGSPRLGLCPRWLGRAEALWDGLRVGAVEEAGDFVRLAVRTPQGDLGPFHFESPDAATAFLAEALVEQGRNREPALPDAAALALRHLRARNRCRASVAVSVGPAAGQDGGADVAVVLTPPADLEEHLPPALYPRGPVAFGSALDWLQEANMVAYVRAERCGLRDLMDTLLDGVGLDALRAEAGRAAG